MPVSTRARSVARTLVVLAVALAAVGGATGPTTAAAGRSAASAALVAPALADPGLVPSVAAGGYPMVSSEPKIRAFNDNCPAKGCLVPREVLATDQAGRTVLAGGNFLSVELPDGTSSPQEHFAAWDVDSKQLVCPGLDVDGEVLAVEPGNSPTSVYVAGRFSSVTDAAGVTTRRTRVAKLDLASCTVDQRFVPPALNAKVDDLALLGNRLFVGGDFDTIGGQPVSTLAELAAHDGGLRPAFSFSFTGGLTSRLRALDVAPDGRRLLVAGRFGVMSRDGVSVQNPTAVVDVSGATPVLLPHSSAGYRGEYGRVRVPDLQDASFSPDGSVVGLVYGTATVSDYVFLTPLTEAPGTRPLWRHGMRDSGFGIGVSDTAVYVAGHFCKIAPGPGPTRRMRPVPGITTDCSGAFERDGVWRSKLAALSRTDGTPLAWNPGSHSFRGGQAVTVTDRGLLVGFDGNRTGSVRTGALAFFDGGA